ncbi:hypothetical protein EYR41_001808 [Orbilia oligospora]|uniref:Uncharacterized protein n=1 Tax=Orbilia oligospora TaxID=2813651 RepID=A0A8H2HUM8_ORBOL|nr:hypothetical protein EYR41_001808 [Orbilia oligospora]
MLPVLDSGSHDDHNYDLYFLGLTSFDGEKVDAEHPSIPFAALLPHREKFLRRGANFGFCVYVVFGNDGHPKSGILDNSFAIDFTASVWDTSSYESLSHGLDGKYKIIVDREELEEYDSGDWFSDGDEAEIPERFGIKRENNCKGETKRLKGAKSAKEMRQKIPGKTGITMS